MRAPGRESNSLAGAAPREIGLEAMMVGKQAEIRRAGMSQVVTPEEMAALLEGLREAEGRTRFPTSGLTRGDHVKRPGVP